MWAYGASYRILDDAAPEYAAIASQHARLGLTHWRRVAAWVVEEAGGQSVQARFDALVHRLGVVNGVVLVEPGAAPFVLRGNLPGKLVVAVHGGRLILDGTNLNDRPSDLLTVVALGSHVEVQGEVHASLVLASLPAGDRSGPPDPVVSFTADAVLRGGLVAERLGPGSVLAGSLLREEKCASGTAGAGALADRYVVLFSPTTVYRRVVNR
ncbi:MAG: hypothetical protein HY814_07420 [Candidatus Riflebacteria bacterium]|nr:hypothetical protein [Candidatus Riflebacteria bacterium]